MEQGHDLFFTLIFFAAILGLVVAGILYFYNRNSSLSPSLLAGYLFMISIMSLHTGLTYTSFYVMFPHFWRSASWASFCGPPIAFLYVRSVAKQSFRLKKWDWLFFLPALLYTLNLVPYYLQSGIEKLKVVHNFMSDYSLIAREPEGLLPMGWGTVARLVYGLILLAFQFEMLMKARKKINASGHPLKQNEMVLRWLFLFTATLSFMYLVLVGEHIFHLSLIINLATMIFFTVSATILFISLSLLSRPSVLYGIQGWIRISPDDQVVKDLEVINSPSEEKRPSLTVTQGRYYKETIEHHLENNRPFVKTGYKIRDMSLELDIPTYQLSAFINQEYGKNFNELINGYRLDYLAEIIKDSSRLDHYTIDAIGKEVGFNSRNAMIAAVRKKTGMKPSEFFNSVRETKTA